MKKLLTAFFIILLFSGCIPTQWKQVGFTGQEQKGNSYEDWQKAGYSPYVAGYYKKNGFSLNELEKWKKNGFDDKLSRWGKSEIISYKELFGNNIELAKKWKKATYNSLKEIKFFKRIGVQTAEEFVKYEKVLEEYYSTPSNLKAIKICKENNISIEELEKLGKLGIKDVNDIVYFKKEKISYNKINSYFKKGIKDIYFIKSAITNNISADTILPYYNIGITDLGKIYDFSQAHIKPTIAKKYANLSRYYLNKKRIFKIIKNCPNGVRDFGFDSNLKMTNSISELNPMTTKGKCFNSIWKVSQILSPKEIVVREYSENDKYLGVQFNGRQSIIIFNRLPDYVTEGVAIVGIVKGIGYEKMSRVSGGSVYVDKFKPVILEKSNIKKLFY